MNELKPFVKWVGGKRQLIPKLVSKMPKTYKNYYEPFVGGGALLFHIKPKTAVINDLNTELINAYNVIKNNYKKLREYLLLMEYGHNEDFFKKIRSMDRNTLNDNSQINMGDSKELRAARFIYLNKACFNGLYRVNSSGYFNVPSGKRKKVKTHEYPNLEYISVFLKKCVVIKNQNYYNVAIKAKKGDFVYFDPPYDYEKGIKGFDSYQKGGFGSKGQEKLAHLCSVLNSNGVKFMVSNHNTNLIQKLYKDFNIEIIKAKRVVGGKGASRKDVEEVIITNYADKK